MNTIKEMNSVRHYIGRKIKTDQKFKCKSKKRAACPKRFILNKIVAF